VQVLCIDELPRAEATEAVKEASGLPLPPELAPRMLFEGYRLVRELHASSRSHAWLAIDEAIQVPVVIKVPATDQREDTRALERLMLEEWVARRVDSAYLLKAGPASRKRQHLFTVMEYVQGQTLAQWMIDHPRPTLEEVRGVVEQIARGLRVLHRAEMVHQDVRPENVMIDGTASVKVIDFGSIRVAGIEEAAVVPSFELPGLAQYMAPELFLGGEGTARSDLFSLAVIAYQMLTGRLPYGMEVPKCRSLAEQKRLRYQSLHELRRDLPAWVDDTLRKALHPEPHRRHGDVSEFAYALQHPDPDFRRQRVPLAERDPLTFWRLLTLILAVCCVVLLGVVMRLGTPAH